MRLAVAGAGYVGLTTAIGFVRHGHSVDLIDLDSERVAELRNGRMPFAEPTLALELKQYVNGQVRLHDVYPSALLDVDFAFICVDTHSDSEGRLDSSRVYAAAASLARACGPDCTLVIRSTVNPGTTRALADFLAGKGMPTTVLANPEFLREGTSLQDFDHPDRRVIGGDDQASLRRLAALYDFSDADIIVTDAASAELIKLASNAALAARVSMANEIAHLASAAGADVQMVLDGVGRDPRIGRQYLQPGIGFGGSCLPKDLDAFRAAAADRGVKVAVFDGASETNDEAIERLVRNTRDLVGQNDSARVAVVGLGFKPGTDSVRRSQSMRLVRRLIGEGWDISVLDPIAERSARRELNGEVRYLETFEEALQGHDVVIQVHPGEATVTVPNKTTKLDALGRQI
jgi:UDPglucose 6-dehydrogenase